MDEVESLSSIYDKQWKTEDEGGCSYSVNISDSVTLYVTLPLNYPSKAPPTYQISAPKLSNEEKREISRILEETYLYVCFFISSLCVNVNFSIFKLLYIFKQHFNLPYFI